MVAAPARDATPPAIPFAAVILSVVPLIFRRCWHQAELLLIGAILAPSTRIVTSLLPLTGLARERRFVNDRRALRNSGCNRTP